MFDPYLDSQEPLVPGAATAAIILLEDGRYLLQHRDPIAEIFFPDHWGMFGGGTEPGETDEQGLRRELLEEITLDVPESALRYFTRFDFDFDVETGFFLRFELIRPLAPGLPDGTDTA